MREFNKKLSSGRITVEHAFGNLKKRFPSLKALGTHVDPDDTYRTVHALMVLHNICIDHGDAPELVPGFDGEEHGFNAEPDALGQLVPESERVPQNEGDTELRTQGLAKRDRLFNALIP